MSKNVIEKIEPLIFKGGQKKTRFKYLGVSTCKGQSEMTAL